MAERDSESVYSGVSRAMNDWFRVLGRAVEATRNGILITDPNRPDNPIVYANPAFERITGYTPEEAIGRNCRFLQRFDRDQPELEEVRAAIREERDCRVVVRNYRKDGTLFWQELSISPVRDERGRLTHFVGVQDDVTERKLAEARVAHQAFHDPLTGLPNRLLFMDRLRDALSRAARGGGEMVAVFAVGLDGFGTFNETHGHDAGDRLLASAAERLEGCLRQEDAVARLGGDEFVILLDGVADTEAAIQFAKKVSEALRKPLLHEEGAPRYGEHRHRAERYPTRGRRTPRSPSPRRDGDVPVEGRAQGDLQGVRAGRSRRRGVPRDAWYRAEAVNGQG